MDQTYNIYCDESCHMENDRQPIMALGAIWCPKSVVKKISRKIRTIKSQHNARGELKWTKTSNSKRSFYIELINYFFENTSLHFRALVVRDKSKLDHYHFNKGSHDAFYYKMYFSLLNKILDPTRTYYIYLDIKDTQSRQKLLMLETVLCNNFHDFTSQMIKHIQHIRSQDSELIQFSDFLLGAVSYRNRDLSGNATKIEIVRLIEEKIKQNLKQNTSLLRRKFNIFIFTPSEVI